MPRNRRPFPAVLFENYDAGVSDGIKDLSIVKVGQTADLSVALKEYAQLFAIASDHPFVRGDKAEDSPVIQKLDSTLIKVNVEIRSSGEAVVEFLERYLSDL